MIKYYSKIQFFVLYCDSSSNYHCTWKPTIKPINLMVFNTKTLHFLPLSWAYSLFCWCTLVSLLRILSSSLTHAKQPYPFSPAHLKSILLCFITTLFRDLPASFWSYCSCMPQGSVCTVPIGSYLTVQGSSSLMLLSNFPKLLILQSWPKSTFPVLAASTVSPHPSSSSLKLIFPS